MGVGFGGDGVVRRAIGGVWGFVPVGLRWVGGIWGYGAFKHCFS